MQAADIWYQCTDGIPGAKTANNPISLSKNNTNTWECLCGTAMSPYVPSPPSVSLITLFPT